MTESTESDKRVSELSQSTESHVRTDVRTDEEVTDRVSNPDRPVRTGDNDEQDESDSDGRLLYRAMRVLHVENHKATEEDR